MLLISSQITTYLGKRDFVDHIDHIDPVGKLCLLDDFLLIWAKNIKIILLCTLVSILNCFAAGC